MTTELETVSQDRSLVFGTSDPTGIINKATKIANALVPLIEKKKLYKTIGQKKHVYVEGWNTMLAMLGVFPSMTRSNRLDRPDEIAYLARVELRHVSGAIVGSGEALCSSMEKNWSGKDEFQVNSMAQTRATGKAARLSFSWIMNLAGYAEVPAEEITEEERPPIAEPQRKVEENMGSFISEQQGKELYDLWKKNNLKDQQVKDFLKARYGIESTRMIKKTDYEAVKEWIKGPA